MILGIGRIGLLLLVLSLGAYAALGVRGYSGTYVGASTTLGPNGGSSSTDGEIVYLAARPTDFRFSSSSNGTLEYAIYNYTGITSPELRTARPLLQGNFSGGDFFTYTPLHRGYFLIFLVNLGASPTNESFFVSSQPGSFEPDLFADLTFLLVAGLVIFLGATLVTRRPKLRENRPA